MASSCVPIHYIYEIYCTELRKNYYGQTNNFRRRYTDYRHDICHKKRGRPVDSCMCDNAKCDWRMHIVAIADGSLINIVEQHYIPRGNLNELHAKKKGTELKEPVITEDEQKQYRCIPYYYKDEPSPDHELYLKSKCDHWSLTGLMDAGVVDNRPTKVFPIQVQYNAEHPILPQPILQPHVTQPVADIQYIYRLKNYRGDLIYYGIASNAFNRFRRYKSAVHQAGDDTDLINDMHDMKHLCWSYEIAALADKDLTKHILSCFILRDSTITDKSKASASRGIAKLPPFTQQQRDTYFACIPYFYSPPANGKCYDKLPDMYRFPWIMTASTQDRSQIDTDGPPKRNDMFLVQPIEAIVYESIRPNITSLRRDHQFLIPAVNANAYDLDTAIAQSRYETKRINIETGLITDAPSGPAPTPKQFAMPKKRGPKKRVQIDTSILGPLRMESIVDLKKVSLT